MVSIVPPLHSLVKASKTIGYHDSCLLHRSLCLMLTVHMLTLHMLTVPATRSRRTVQGPACVRTAACNPPLHTEPDSQWLIQTHLESKGQLHLQVHLLVHFAHNHPQYRRDPHALAVTGLNRFLAQAQEQAWALRLQDSLHKPKSIPLVLQGVENNICCGC